MVEFLYLIGGTRCKMSNAVELHVKVMDFSWDHEFKVLRGGVFPVILSLNLLRLIPILFFNCSVEDGGVASAGISGQYEGVLDEKGAVDSPESLCVEPGALGHQCHRERDSKEEVPRFLPVYRVR